MLPGRLSGCCGLKTRNSSAGSIAMPPSSVLCAESSACLNGAPDVDFARFDPFGRFLKAQDRHCAVSRRSVARRA